PEIIREILDLPRLTLVEDLARVLDDCIVRTPNFMKHDVGEGDDHAAVHALHFLAEIEGYEAVDSFLRFLSIHPDALEFWIGDELNYDKQISRIIAGDIPRCVEWLKAPAIGGRAKGMLAEAMEYLARRDARYLEPVIMGV